MEADAAEIDDFRIVGIDADLAEVHRPGVRVVHLAPGRAGVVGPVEPGGVVRVQHLLATAARAAALSCAGGARRRARAGFRRRRSAAAPAALL